MTEFFGTIAEKYNRFEDWFNRKYGWFFTNGMKVEDVDQVK